MSCSLLVLFLLGSIAFIGLHADVQEQEPEDHEHLVAHVKELERNLTELWGHVNDLEKATLRHLTHLRQHQLEVESILSHMVHHDDHHSSGHEDDHHGDHVIHGDDHHDDHHDDQQTSHSNDHHNDHHSSHSSDHNEDHSHSSDHHDDHHSHSSDHHDDHHSHSSDHHSSHDDDHHHDDSHHDDDEQKSATDDHDHHGHHHEDHSKEKEHDDHSKDHDDHHQQKEVIEPLVVPIMRKGHDYYEKSKVFPKNIKDILAQFSLHETTHQNVTLPKLHDPNYYFATCNVHHNSVKIFRFKPDITGEIALFQKKSGGPLGIYVHLKEFNINDHHDDHQQHDDPDHNEVPVAHVGHKHGFHVHESGDISTGCNEAGPHFNPERVNHGGLHSNIRHVGDFGNIECDDHGLTDVLFYDEVATLSGHHSIMNRSIVIHENEDDLGVYPDDSESLATGNSGVRIACCTIHSVKRLEISTYNNLVAASKGHEPR